MQGMYESRGVGVHVNVYACELMHVRPLCVHICCVVNQQQVIRRDVDINNVCQRGFKSCPKHHHLKTWERLSPVPFWTKALDTQRP